MTKSIEKILSPYLNENHSLQLNELKSVTNYLDKADSKTIAFYRLGPGEKNLEVFKERYQQAKPGCVILLGDYKGEKIINIIEEDLEKLQIELCDLFYPLKKMNLIGVTGTNGKTSTVNFISEILNSQNSPTATLGTLGLCHREKLIHDFKMTTPGYIEIRQAIHLLPPEIENLAMEISSHGLNQKRLGNLRLNFAAWTNFTQDHLDYHKTMDEYFQAKAKIKKYNDGPLLIPNNTDMESLLTKNKLTFLKVEKFEKLDLINTGSYFDIHYHRENFELAYALAKEVLNEIKTLDMNEISCPEGRFEIIERSNRMFVVDYAHTPDALEKLLSEIKNNFSEQKLKVVFGCGGDRDAGKRSLMGRTASEFADMIYITDDNPRSEKPEDITAMIAEAVTIDYKIINDREKAIEQAYAESEEKDIIVIAGKGHEKYQEVNGVRSYFSDQDIVRSLI